MISIKLQRQVLKLRADGATHRAIAAATHLGRTTVAKILHRGKVKRVHGNVTINERYRRCPRCGAKAELIRGGLYCQECDPRNKRSEPVARERVPDLSLNLADDDRKRYEQLRAWRDEQHEIHGKNQGDWDQYPGFDTPEK